MRKTLRRQSMSSMVALLLYFSLCHRSVAETRCNPCDYQVSQCIDNCSNMANMDTNAGGVAICLQNCDACLLCGRLEVTKQDPPKQPGKSCFIATAAYGSEMAPAVAILRHLRDKYLVTNSLGQIFVVSYYSLGPYLAIPIAENEQLRQLTRLFLTPLIRAAVEIDATLTKSTPFN